MNSANAPYSSGRLHLADELQLLDLRLRALAKNASPREQFAGLIVTENEIGRFMERAGPLCSAHGHDDDALIALEQEILGAAQIASTNGVFLPLPELAVRFGLTRFEEEVLLLCLAPELDRKYDKLFGYLHDDVTSRRPTVGLALELFCTCVETKLSARGAFAATSRLLHFGLVRFEDDRVPLIARALKIDDRIVDYLLQVPRADARIAPQRSFDVLDIAPEVTQRVRAFLQKHVQPDAADTLPAIFYLNGTRDIEARRLAEAACTELGIALLVVDVERLPETPETFEREIVLLAREAMLVDAAVCLEHCDALLGADTRLRFVLDTMGGRLTFFTGNAPWRAKVDLGTRMLAEVELAASPLDVRRKSWEKQLNGAVAACGLDSASLAARFRFTPRQIELVAGEAASRAWWQSPDDARIDMRTLEKICRLRSTPMLGTLARRIEPRRRWSDLILPHDEMAQLHEFCNHARFRNVVYGDWGFDQKLKLGRGLNALFCGTPGAGKTLAAEVVASELGLDMYKVDLSQVVSKFIGETEKQLRQVFDEAQGSDAILFFDEADALFGKRSEVKDAHDRYANIEIGYLLQRMEEYDGIAVMATNMRKSIDEAFIRRLQFIVEFPFPEERERAQIWRAHLPSQLPLAPDLDLDFLAATFKLSGGYIRNVVVGAAFQAAADGGALGMGHVVRTVRREFQKMGRTCPDSEFGRFAALLRERAS